MRSCLFFVSCLALVACTREPTTDATQITLRLSGSPEVVDGAAFVRIQIAPLRAGAYRPGQELLFERAQLRFPFDVPMVPGRGKPRDESFEVVAQALSQARVPLVEARVITNFVPGARKLLGLRLEACGVLGESALCTNEASCHGPECLTCLHGSCMATPNVPGQTLPDLTHEITPEGDASVVAPPAPEAGPPELDAGLSGEFVEDPARCLVERQVAERVFGSMPVPYVSDARLPSHVYRSERNELVESAYVDWRNAFLVPERCGAGVVHAAANGDPQRMTTSEAHGAAMLIVALMAGYDPDAKQLFDGLVRYFLGHRASGERYLMARAQRLGCTNIDTGSASDGDLDIAYALLLADKQWGSGGEFDYRSLSRAVMASIRRRDVDAEGHYMLLGSGVEPGDGHYDGTRTSDFMPGHLASFAEIDDRAFWSDLARRGYAMVEELQQKYARETGLLPDFVQGMQDARPVPAANGFFLEAQNDAFGQYACRTPLRIALHYVTTGSSEAKAVVERMNAWMDTSTSGDPAKIRAGYRLDGTPLQDSTSMAFVAPLGVAAMVSERRDWLNALWDTLADETRRDNRYLGDSLRLLSLIVMSGNWWTPESVSCPAPEPELPEDAGMSDADAGKKPVPSECYYGPWVGDDHVLASQAAPCGRLGDEVPMFVSLGFSDTGNVEGMDWALAAASTVGASFTFFVTCQAGQSPDVLAAWRRAAEAGHELAVSSMDALPADGTLDQAGWLAQIDACSQFLRDNGLAGSGVLGFRAPQALYGDASLSAVRAAGLMYDSSIVEGIQTEQDGQDFFFPYTLDWQSPGHTVRVGLEGVPELAGESALWELPIYALMPPPALRRTLARTASWFEIKVAGNDLLLWTAPSAGGLAMGEEEVFDTLAYSLGRRLRGNRAPLTLALSTDHYTDVFSARAPAASTSDRRKAIERFLIHASAQDARIMSHAQVVQWTRDPRSP